MIHYENTAMAEAKEMNSYSGNSYARNRMPNGYPLSREPMRSQDYGYSGDHFPYRPAEYPEMRNW